MSRQSINIKIKSACAEIEEAATSVREESLSELVKVLTESSRIFVYGVGREGLTMKGFAMRLYHLGMDSNVVGEMTTPQICPGDTLVVSAGPGEFATVQALVRIARDVGANAVCFTAQPLGTISSLCNCVVHVLARTMAEEKRKGKSDEFETLLMGSVYEGALFVILEAVISTLRENLKVSKEIMTKRHTNLE